MSSKKLLSDYFWRLKQCLRALERLAFCITTKLTYCDVMAIWQSMHMTFTSIFAILFKRALKISSHVTNFLLCISCVGSGSLLDVRKRNVFLFHEFHQVVSKMLTSQIHFLYGMWQSETLVDGHSWSQRVSRIEYHTCCLAWSEKS